MQPKVSIIMAVYNEENIIKKAINSILNQSFKNFELIIINDCSSDNTLKKIEELLKEKDHRIKVINNKVNIGLTKSLNKAIKIARGKYIARQDADDYSLPKRLEKQIKFLDDHPDYAFCGTEAFVKQNKHAGVKYYRYKEIFNRLILYDCFYHSTIMIRRNVFNICGIYDENYFYGQDYELWCRIIYKYRLKAVNIPEKLVIMNIPQEKLSEKSKKFVIQHKNCIKTKFRYLKDLRNIKLTFLVIIISIINFLEILYVEFNIFKRKFFKN
ncbi:MAG: glycosyltransferase family 2 protein [Promethearchaeota archaeon]